MIPYSGHIQKYIVTLQETPEQEETEPRRNCMHVLHSHDSNKYRQTSGSWNIIVDSHAFKTTFSDGIMVKENKENSLFAQQQRSVFPNCLRAQQTRRTTFQHSL